MHVVFSGLTQAKPESIVDVKSPQSAPTEPDASPTVAAVQRDLAAIRKRYKRLADSGRAASALALAREMDSESSATSNSMCARALNETLAELEALAPPEAQKDGLDDLSTRRAKRLERSAAAKG